MILNLERKRRKRQKRKHSIRKRVVGTPEKPRLSVFRSARHTYAQVVDDYSGLTLVAASTLDRELKDQLKGLKKLQQAQKVGELLARRCLEKGIKTVVFDRSGYAYHGRVAGVAVGVRAKGLKV
jgi:large subunit ribosomal protein L18